MAQARQAYKAVSTAAAGGGTSAALQVKYYRVMHTGGVTDSTVISK